jgi:hypothetical protein
MKRASLPFEKRCGHTYPVHGWLFCGGFEIVPEKVGAGLRPVGEITMHLFI